MLCCVKQKEPFSCEVSLLDGSHVTFSKNQNIKVTSKGHVLLEVVCHHLNLVEKDYFGIKFVDLSYNNRWLDPAKALCNDEQLMKVISAGQCSLKFAVKFYPADPCSCKEEVTRYQFFLQLKQDILTSRLPCSWKKAAELSALALQSEIGDFHPSEHKSGYVSEFRFVQNQDEQFEYEVGRLHAMFKGLVPASAEMQYLRKCRQLDMYGVEMNPVKGDAGMQFMLGISPRGIETFKNKYRIAVYYWPRITLVDYKDRRMKITVKTKQGNESIHNFELRSSEECQLIWKSVVEHHVFYRLPQNVVNTTWNNKFRYSGRTEAEILQSEVEREEPEVHRGSSKRYPPRSAKDGEEAVAKENIENNNKNMTTTQNDDRQNTQWNQVMEKKGMFSVSDVEQNMAVKYMTPKSERRERNRQLQSLSDTENRNRKHRSGRGRSSGEESDSPSKRRIRSRARQKHSNYQSDASDVSHRRKRRNYHTDTEMGNRVRLDIEKSKRRQNSISSPQSESRSQRRQKRLSREDEAARQQLWQHFRRDVVEPTEPTDAIIMNDISYTEVKTEGNPNPSRRHRHRSTNKRSSTVSGFSALTLDDGMVSPLQITTTVQQEKQRSMQSNGHNHHHKYKSPQKPGKDWDTKTSLSVEDFRSVSSVGGKHHRSRHHKTRTPATPESAQKRNIDFKPVYSEI
uniref:Band 4.1-like protein 4 n=1 Tax=Phallusia mammillata TaxID=59560 RepID=A0A6F9DDW3_9ASCI|nr:band 4.1-like protein 4 [Phallusia mammillata]